VETAWKWPGATPGISVISNRATVCHMDIKGHKEMVFAAGTYEECWFHCTNLFSWPLNLHSYHQAHLCINRSNHYPISLQSHTAPQLAPATLHNSISHALHNSPHKLSHNSLHKCPTPLREPQCITLLSAYKLQPVNHHHNPTPSKSLVHFITVCLHSSICHIPLLRHYLLSIMLLFH